QLAAAPAAAAARSAPVRLASAQRPEPAVVVTARRSLRAARAEALDVEPLSFASAEAPAPLPTTLASMSMVLRHLPRTALAPRPAPHQAPAAFASSVPPPELPHVEVHHRLVRVSASGGEARFFVVGHRLTPEEAAELRKAVGQAAAERQKVKFRRDRGEDAGSSESLFDIHIQTLVKGEEAR
ncbi:MAG TPA: hypothetical protein VF547_01460, partial [Allosphingosinicella sp.]